MYENIIISIITVERTEHEEIFKSFNIRVLPRIFGLSQCTKTASH
jgi:hypothetical protein